MNPQPNPSAPLPAEPPEPIAGRAPVPPWLLILLIVLIYWGMVYFDQRGGWFNSDVYLPYQSYTQLQTAQPPTGGVDLGRGKAVYENVCALCHNVNGTGNPGQAPPFANSEWVLGNPNRLIRIPLAGLTGPVQVHGQEYNLPSMPAMGAALSDEDLAAVLSYMRQSWGNKAEPITADQVKAVRAQVGNRTQPWTAGELNSVQ